MVTNLLPSSSPGRPARLCLFHVSRHVQHDHRPWWRWTAEHKGSSKRQCRSICHLCLLRVLLRVSRRLSAVNGKLFTIRESTINNVLGPRLTHMGILFIHCSLFVWLPLYVSFNSFPHLAIRVVNIRPGAGAFVITGGGILDDGISDRGSEGSFHWYILGHFQLG